MEFTYLYVPEVSKYLGQELQVNFADGTARDPLKITWSAILVPDSVTGPDAEKIVNTGTGTDGFSPKR